MDENGDDFTFDGGALIVTLSSWQKFHKQASSLKSKRGYVWRGQQRDETSGWSLKSSFDREVVSKSQSDREKKLEAHLNNFKEAMNKFYPGLLPRDEVDMWALGQQYGLLTPLLDWTLSPYIAAYFAFVMGVEQGDQNDSFRYVYALSRSLERLISKKKQAGQLLSPPDRSVVFVDRLPYPNPRFAAQRGIFTNAFQGNDISKYVQSYSRKRPNQAVILKFKIPTRDREECLHDLHLMNIDHTSLLLDLHDAIDYCSSQLPRSNLAVPAIVLSKH